MPGPVIHPTAIVDPRAELAEGVIVGPFAILDGAVRVGPRTVIRARANLVGPLILGEGNDVGMGVVLGERPQHLGYDGTETLTEIGHFNTFREYATVHRPMPGGRTRIGDRNLFMTGAHVAHDCVIGNDVIMVNHSAAAGHVVVGDRAFVSAHAMVHQFCRVGSLAMLSGASASTMDVPPFWIMQRFNVVCGVNVVGMKRAGIPPLEIMAVRKAFKMIYVEKMGIRDATDRIEAELGHHAAVRTLIEFLRVPGRGVPGVGRYDRNLSTAEAA
jgi:UDP-N-acetylglucosamine acyltransferase